MSFSVIDNDKEIVCDILFTFRDDANDINYVVYTDGTKDKDDNECIYSSRYIIDNEKYILKPIEKEYEWNLINNMLQSKYKKGE